MAHWMCTLCGYYLQGLAPPDRCPSCHQACVFNDVTCYRPECGGEKNVDPVVVSSILKTITGGPEPSVQSKTPSASESISLLKILTEHRIGDADDLEQLSFWAISQVDILRGLTRQQREQLKELGQIEYYEPNVDICTEGMQASKFYLVEEGRVAVESQVARGMRFPISIVYPGQAFGWSALVLPYVYTATVMALAKTKVISIEQEPMLKLMQANPSLGLTIMENVASIVASRLRTVELALAGLLRKGS